MRPPNEYDNDAVRAMMMAEECERRAECYPDPSYFNGLRDQWLQLACDLEMPRGD